MKRVNCAECDNPIHSGESIVEIRKGQADVSLPIGYVDLAHVERETIVHDRCFRLRIREWE